MGFLFLYSGLFTIYVQSMLYSAILMSFYIKALYQNPSPVRLKIGLYGPDGFIEGDRV